MSIYIPRLIRKNFDQSLARGKSILLLGPRQTGKTTFITEQIHADLSYSFASLMTRQRYEKNPALLEAELNEQIKTFKQPPFIFIDEVQKIPRVMDIAQYFIDKKAAQFILTGSSARKLITGPELNLLPGRVVVLTMTPLLYEEIPEPKPTLDELLLYGMLPGIRNEENDTLRETDLYSYVSTYMEEEIRSEALVRNVGNFARFLEIAAGEAGRQVNFTRLSQDIGIADTTIANYYQILEDCLITHRVDPISDSTTKRRLIKSPKYLFFDLGVRRACANEGTKLSLSALGNLFEQYIGIALINKSRLISPHIKIKYWRDASGPEIDFVIDHSRQYIPIEVKWTDKASIADAKYLLKFIDDYPETRQGYIVCRTPQKYKLTDQITVLPWQSLNECFLNMKDFSLGHEI